MDTTAIVLIIYLVTMFFVAWYFSRKQSTETYFVNQRKTSLWFMTFSTTTTVVGAGAVVAIVSEVYNTGISYGLALPISLMVGMLVLGLMAKKIKEIGDQYNAHTIVDFFEKRFGRKNKILAGWLQLFLLVIWIGIQATALASLASVLVGLDYVIALFFSAAIVILYTTIGGLKVDIINDFISFWITIVIFVAMAIIGYQSVGGFDNLFTQLPKSHLDPLAFGGISWFIGVILVSGFLYLGNTTHWQRIFSAESQNTAKKSFYLSIPFMAFLSVLVLFLGLVAAVKLPLGIDKETAIFALMKEILPPWMVGFGFASILAVILDSIDSLFIGGSTIIYKALFGNKNLEAKKQMTYARLITAIFGIIGFGLALLIPNIVTLSLLVTYLALIFVPPIFAGIYSKKTSENACFYSILIPTVILFVLFPILKEQTFVITTPLSVLIVIFYDKIFGKKDLVVIQN